MFKIVCVTARALCPGDFLAQLERVAAAGVDKIILREKDLPEDQYQALAGQVIAYDDVIDDYFNRIKANLIGLIRLSPESGETALDLLMIAKYLERIGDHATNIAEWVEYSVTGTHKGAQAE